MSYNPKSYRKFLTATVTAAVVTSMVAPSVVTVQAEDQIQFTDLKQGDRFYTEVQELVNRDIITGFPNDTFRPTMNVTRGEAAKMLAIALDLNTEDVVDPGFKDVKNDKWYFPYIAALVEANIISGFTDEIFKPEEKLTRAEAAKIIAKGFNFAENANAAASFTDVDSSGWSAPFVGALVENGITNGKTATSFAPTAKTTRGEIAAFIYRSLHATKTITNVTATSVEINGVTYDLSEEVKPILNTDNQAALENALITFEQTGSTITKITSLEITASGQAAEDGQDEFSGHVVLDGNNAEIDGNMKISSDYVTIKNLNVNGNFEIGQELQHSFYSDNLVVQGQTIISEDANGTVQSSSVVSAAAESNIQIIFENATLQAVEVNRHNASIEAKGETTLTELTIASNAKIVAAPEMMIPKITVQSGANTVEVNATVTDLIVASDEEMTLSGMTNIENVKINTSNKVNLDTIGQINKIEATNTAANISVSGDITVKDVVVPEGSTVADLIENYDDVKGNIENIGGEENPDYVLPADQIKVESFEQLKDALANEAKTTIIINADIETPEELVVNRPVTINGKNHKITFTGNEAGWQGDYTLQVYNTTGVTIENLALTGGDGALLVNGSEVTLLGSIDVSGNEFGGIEVSKGVGITAEPALTVTEAEFINTTEGYGLPTFWEDGGSDKVIGFNGTVIIKGTQPQYYLDADHSIDPTTIANVTNMTELKTALTDTAKTTINITEDFEIIEEIVIGRTVTINGGDHKITFTGNEAGWQGDYAFHVYNTTGVTISNIALTGADGALLVNGSEVALTGSIEVSGNEFGGIEVSKGVGITAEPSLTVSNAEFINTTESYGLPTIWEDGGSDKVIGFNGTVIIKGTQPQYYLDAEHSNQ